jgi:hypothetical protein
MRLIHIETVSQNSLKIRGAWFQSGENPFGHECREGLNRVDEVQTFMFVLETTSAPSDSGV